MTVQDAINELQKIQNKNLIIVIWDNQSGAYVEANSILEKNMDSYNVDHERYFFWNLTTKSKAVIITQ